MASAPLVSVIIPAYNSERYLGVTLASVQAQTYRNLEIIIVDDGSTDSTALIAEQTAQADDRIRVIHQANLGVAVARNRGLAEAKGEFVAPLDADDIWHPENLSLQVAELRKAGPDVAVSYAWFVTIDEHGTFASNGPRSRLRHKQDVLLAELKGNFIGNASSTVMRRTAVEAMGGYTASLRERDAQGCEDQALYISLAQHWNYTFVDQYLIAYRKHPGSMSEDHERMALSQALVLADLHALRLPLPGYWFPRGVARSYEGLLVAALLREEWAKVVGTIKRCASISLWSLIPLLCVRLPVRVTGFCTRRLRSRPRVPEPERRVGEVFWSTEHQPAVSSASIPSAQSLNPPYRVRI